MHSISRNVSARKCWTIEIISPIDHNSLNSTQLDSPWLDLSQLKRAEPNRTIYRSPSSDGLPVGDHSTISKARSVDSCQLRVLQTCYIYVYILIYISVYQSTRIRLCGQWFVSKNNDTTRNTQSPGLTYPNKDWVCVNVLYIQYIFIYVMFVRLYLCTYCISTINRMCICNSLF